MALKHLPENPRQAARAWNLQLGVPGFKYADLNRVRRIESLDRAFLAELDKHDPQLGADFRSYRNSNGSDRDRLQESELLIRAASHAGAFLARLFRIEDEHLELCDRIRRDDVIFKWKRQSLERRVLKPPPPIDYLSRLDTVELEFAYREVVDEISADTPLTADPERELAVVCKNLQETAESSSDPEEKTRAQA